MSHGVCDESEQNHEVYVNCALHGCLHKYICKGIRKVEGKEAKRVEEESKENPAVVQTVA